MKIYIYRRPHCRKPMKRSRLPQYAFECLDCDEDFYECEAIPDEILFLHCTIQSDNQQGEKTCHT